MSWWALHNGASDGGPALVVFSRAHKRAGELSGLGGLYDLDYPDFNPAGETTAPWIKQAQNDQDVTVTEADPGLGSGYPLRYQFRCRHCGATYPVTNTHMLRELLTAWRFNRREITL